MVPAMHAQDVLSPDLSLPHRACRPSPTMSMTRKARHGEGIFRAMPWMDACACRQVLGTRTSLGDSEAADGSNRTFFILAARGDRHTSETLFDDYLMNPTD